MTTNNQSRNVLPFIRRVMPRHSENALQEADAVFERYMRVVMRIHRRLTAEDSRENEIRGRFQLSQK